MFRQWRKRCASLRRTLLCAGVFALGCDSSQPAPAGDSAAAKPPSVGSETQVVDSTRIAINGPTLIAFYPAIPPSDTSEETATVMDDFSHHLSTATDSLKAMGFRIEMRVVDSVFLAQEKRVVEFRPAKDSADIGYYFARPGKAPMILYGVRTNGDLVQTGRGFLSANR